MSHWKQSTENCICYQCLIINIIGQRLPLNFTWFQSNDDSPSESNLHLLFALRKNNRKKPVYRLILRTESSSVTCQITVRVSKMSVFLFGGRLCKTWKATYSVQLCFCSSFGNWITAQSTNMRRLIGLWALNTTKI